MSDIKDIDKEVIGEDEKKEKRTTVRAYEKDFDYINDIMSGAGEGTTFAKALEELVKSHKQLHIKEDTLNIVPELDAISRHMTAIVAEFNNVANKAMDYGNKRIEFANTIKNDSIKEVNDLYSSIESLLKEKQELKDKISNLEKEVREVRDDAVKIIEENKSLKSEISKLTNKNEELESNNKSLMKLINEKLK